MALPFIPFANVVRVALQHNVNGELVVNVYHVRYPNPIVTANLTALGQAFAVWWSDFYKPTTPPTTALNLISMRNLTTEDGEIMEYTTDLPIVGTFNDAAIPNNVALCVTWRTGLAGRSFRGRSYWGGLSEGMLGSNANILSTAAAMTFVDIATELISALNNDAWSLGVASRTQNGVRRTTGVFTPITSFDINLPFDSQRRRLAGRGA